MKRSHGRRMKRVKAESNSRVFNCFLAIIFLHGVLLGMVILGVVLHLIYD